MQKQAGNRFHSFFNRTGRYISLCGVSRLSGYRRCWVAFAALLFFMAPATVFAASAVLSWNPNAEADLAGYKVYYGTASRSYGAPIDVGNTTSHTVTGLSSTTYFFAVTAYDTSGNESGYSVEVSKTFSASDTTPPLVSSVSASNLSSTAATISWSTDEPADTQIEYGTTTAYGTFTTLDSALITVHSQSLNGLLNGTLYHYRVLSRDAAGNLTVSGDHTLTTSSSPDVTPPVISGITASNVTGTGAVVTWGTDEGATSLVEYGTTTAYGAFSPMGTTLVTSHSRTLSGLSNGVTYHYRVISRDAAGNSRTSGDRTFTTTTAADTAGPVISDISAVATPTSATVTWTTDEAATSKVAFGETTAYGMFSPVESVLVTNHSRTLTGLSPSTTYHYQVISLDGAGNETRSSDRSFATGPLEATDTVPPGDVTAFQATGGDRRITLTWRNPDDLDFSGVRILYRTDRFPDDIHDGTLLGDISGDPNAEMATSHTGLVNGVTYYYLAASYDSHGNFQSTAYASAIPASSSEGGQGRDGGASAGGGGCGIVIPSDGKNGPGPGDAAGMLTLIGVLILMFLRSRFSRRLNGPLSDYANR